MKNPKMFTVTGILCLIAVSSALDDRIHKRMTTQQLAEVFHETDHDLVPDYDVVQIHVPNRKKRDASSPQKLQLRAFGLDISAYVDPGFGELATKDTPVYEAFYRNGDYGEGYRLLPNKMRHVGEIWENPHTKTSLVVKRDTNGKYLMDGYIASKNLIVRSLPDSIAEDLRKNNPGNTSNSLEHSAYHVVYKGDNDHLARFMKTDLATKQNAAIQMADTVIYPEIMVVVDDKCFEIHGRNFDKMLAYLMAFWNGVDMAYRGFRYPEIRLRISQIIIATSPRALPFISNNIVGGFLSANVAYFHAESYFFERLRTFPSNTYDAIMIMSGHLLTTNETVPAENVWGVATRGGMCRVKPYAQIVDSVGIITEDAVFTQILTAAHELGHLFNMSHDGETDAQNYCRGDLGYIMESHASRTKYSYDFSQCSVAEIDKFFNSEALTCTFNVPSVVSPMPRILPGELLTRDDQCLKKGYVSSCYFPNYGQEPCFKIHCYGADGYCDTLDDFPPDGAYCDKGKICIHGKCQYEPEGLNLL